MGEGQEVGEKRVGSGTSRGELCSDTYFVPEKGLKGRRRGEGTMDVIYKRGEVWNSLFPSPNTIK